jgi:hypothetical protein
MKYLFWIVGLLFLIISTVISFFPVKGFDPAYFMATAAMFYGFYLHESKQDKK